MSTVLRYISKEVLYTTLAITTLVVFTFLCNSLIHYLGLIANGQYAADMLLQLTLIQTPILFSLLLPLGLYMALILIYGRLYADSEMVVLFACGMSHKKLLNMTAMIVLMVVAIVGWLVLGWGPSLAKERDQLIKFAKATTILHTMVPGRLQAMDDGKMVFYAKKYSKDGQYLENLFIAQQISSKTNTSIINSRKFEKIRPQWQTIFAKRAQQITDKKTGERFLLAEQGQIFKGIPGQKHYQAIKFDQYSMRIQLPNIIKKVREISTIPTLKLWHQRFKSNKHMAELQWRFSIPLSVIVLALLAIPFSRISPREGRFKYIIPAILIYVVYANFLFLSRNWLENGSIPTWLGLWWPHVTLAALGSFLFMVKN
jgi:lipopolysaccharide export system permease protein